MSDDLNKQYENYSNLPLWEDLAALDPFRVAELSGAELGFEEGHPRYELDFLGGRYAFTPENRTVAALTGSGPPNYQRTIVMLSYLVNAGKGPAPGLSGDEVSPAALPSGAFFFKGPHELMKAPVAEAFGDAPEELVKVALALGAVPHRKLSFRLKALPFVEVYCHIEPADEEFPAEVRYNFDSNIHYYLRLDGIFALINCLSSLLVSMKKSRPPAWGGGGGGGGGAPGGGGGGGAGGGGGG
ncbi:MAG: DUF3786 domain-containing protein, partial [Deltaproteobacteria bacterium]|nr:DUF3786 domain-containing protein [Deltaproteobacteria bacterium]